MQVVFLKKSNFFLFFATFFDFFPIYTLIPIIFNSTYALAPRTAVLWFIDGL